MRRSLSGYAIFDPPPPPFFFSSPLSVPAVTLTDQRERERQRQTDRQRGGGGGGGGGGFPGRLWPSILAQASELSADRLLCRAVSLEHYNLLLYEHSSSVLGASSRNEITCCQDLPPHPHPPPSDRAGGMTPKEERPRREGHKMMNDENWVSPLRRKTSEGSNLFTLDLHIVIKVHD